VFNSIDSSENKKIYHAKRNINQAIKNKE